MSSIVISIDGPAASGKTTIAKLLAEKLGIHFVSSGQFYRAITYAGIQDTISLTDEGSITSWLQELPLTTTWEKYHLHFFFKGEKMDHRLYEEEVNHLVSPFSASSAVRNWVLPHLRALAKDTSLVMEGRDIGSVVFPETPYQFYLTACPQKRQERRSQEGKRDTIAKRDHHDSTREHAPLVTPTNAVTIDTTHHTPSEILSIILHHMKPNEEDGIKRDASKP